jgi:hypothetical protein
MLHDDDSDIAALVKAAIATPAKSSDAVVHRDHKPENMTPAERQPQALLELEAPHRRGDVAAPTLEALSSQLEAELYRESIAPKPRSLVDPRSLPVRFSRLKLFGKSAAHYYHACQEEDVEETLALRLGAGSHAMLFEQPVVCFDGVRRGRAWERFAANHAEAAILNRREWDIANTVVAAVRGNKVAMSLLFEDTIIEQRIDWRHINDRACRSTPDARAKKRVTDLKSTRSADPKWFSRDAWRLWYYAQLAFYGDAIEFETGSAPSEYYLIAVESTEPNPVTVFQLTDELVEHGHKINRLWFEQLLGCEQSGHWPEYSETVVPLELPEFAVPAGVDIEIAGELITVT